MPSARPRHPSSPRGRARAVLIGIAVLATAPVPALAQMVLPPVADAAAAAGQSSSAVEQATGQRRADERQGSAPASIDVTLRIVIDGPLDGQSMGAQEDRPRMLRVPPAPAMRSFAPMPRPLVPLPVAPPIRWDTRKGPKCIATRTIAGVRAATRDSIDILTRERERLRLELERGCRALDFYSGFYMAQSDDASLCRERDLIQARSGERCTVKHIRRLVAVPVRD